jgi:hypothetical protein
LDETFWDKHKKKIIGGTAALVLFIIILIVALSSGSEDTPFGPVIPGFKMSTKCLNKDNAEYQFTYDIKDSDTWVEDISANHNFYLIAEGCLNQT